MLSTVFLPGKVKEALSSIFHKHLPTVQKEIVDKHVPFIVEKSKVGVTKLREIASTATQKTSEGFTSAGSHFGVVKENVGKGFTTAGTHLAALSAVASERTSQAVSIASEKGSQALSFASEKSSQAISLASEKGSQALTVAGTHIKDHVSKL